MLDQEDAGSYVQSHTIKDVIRAAQRGIDLTSNLQAFAGRQRLNRRTLELNAVVERTLAGLRSSLTGISVDSALAASELIVYADEKKLSDTIVELVSNANDAMPPAQGCLTITTKRHQLGNQYPRALLSIVDNGCGMAPEVAARAMEPLFTTSPHRFKTGWGLSNCAGFVRQSGGTMTLTSEPGRGTAIEILLPLENI